MAASKVIRNLLFSFNFFFFIAGICILTGSIYARNHKAEYQISEELLPALDLLIFISAVTLVFGYLGSYAVIHESRCALALFFCGLLKMFLLLLAVGVLGAISRTERAQEVVKQHLELFTPLSEQPEDVQKLFQDVERNDFCCGMFVGHLDWGNSTLVPNSCNCTDTTRNCTVVEGREIYSTPCMVYLMTWMDRVSNSLVGVALGFGGLMILGMLFSLVLCCQIRSGKNSII
uniref:tetraspanin-8-like n=1 Tax=Semicossyphus pulcher TaxID=241346 RepID=UPI0037E8ED82